MDVDSHTDRRRLLQWQFELTWSLASHHFTALSDEELWWPPTQNAWTMRRDDNGRWIADWAEPEPDIPPPPTIAWLTWHIQWWWTTFAAVLDGGSPQGRNIDWPGTAEGIRAAISALAEEWRHRLNSLDDDDLDRIHPRLWPWNEPRRLAIGYAWVNSELMKNIAELGVLRHLAVQQP